MSITRLSSECPQCKRPLRRRKRRDGSGEFLGCSGWPKCDFVESVDLNVERIEANLSAARADIEFLNDWIAAVRTKIKTMKDATGMECPRCAKHLAELEAML